MYFHPRGCAARPGTQEIAMRIAALALGFVIVAGACASSGTAASDQTRTARAGTARTNVITTEEIRESVAPSISDVIRQLRPSWQMTPSVAIVVNNDVMGACCDLLRQQPKSSVTEIRFLTKSEAQMKWGARVQDVIQIITR
jgi:hypothetical protein